MINPKRYSKLSTGDRTAAKLLTEFLVFPKFPPEIRERIFKVALLTQSDAPTILQVEATIAVCDSDFGLFMYLDPMTYDHKRFDTHGDLYRYSRGVGLLRACKESRAVFQNTFKCYLPRPLHDNFGRLHFDDEAVIYIRGFERHFTSNGHGSTAIRHNYKRQSFFETVKHLAIDIPYLVTSELIEAFAAFNRLEHLVGIANHGSWLTQDEVVRWGTVATKLRSLGMIVRVETEVSHDDIISRRAGRQDTCMACTRRA